MPGGHFFLIGPTNIRLLAPHLVLPMNWCCTDVVMSNGVHYAFSPVFLSPTTRDPMTFKRRSLAPPREHKLERIEALNKLLTLFHASPAGIIDPRFYKPIYCIFTNIMNIISSWGYRIGVYLNINDKK